MLVYDFEVFKYDWLVVFKDLSNGEYIEIVNDGNALVELYETRKQDLFIGFNNKRYDDLIFKTILAGGSPQVATRLIIEEDNILGVYQRYAINQFKFSSVDLIQDAMRSSLKEMEGHLGLDIEETSVSFELDRRLTPAEIDETLHYCRHDVDATEYLFNFRVEAVRSKLGLIREFGLSKYDTNKTNGQLVAKILNARTLECYDELAPFDISKLNIDIKNTEITDFYTKNEIDYKNKLIVDIAGVEHKLAYGGLHGAIPNFQYKGELWLIDVTSYYPSMMIHYDYISRGIQGKHKEAFKKIYWDRLDMKRRGEKVKSILYKLILNTTYGCMKNQYNPLYDPHNANNVCIAGQLMLIDLIEKLEPYCQLVQSNTDGIVIIPHDKPKIREMVKDWEERTKMMMEIEVAEGIWQKDVNNYILKEDGKIKVRGGYVYQAKVGAANHGGTMIRNTKSIIDDCVVSYFVYGIEPEQIIGDCDDLMKYQIITKTGGTYYKTVHQSAMGDKIVNKVNRVYATTDKRYGTLKKHKVKDGVLRVDTIASLPDHCYVDNNNMFDITKLDKSWYVNMAWSRINDFLGE